ncbi:MAG: 1,4-dihydroxy-2-naphthoate polyprenyltransferase [Candidatus Binatota bacterium]|jgi:1,4-dihydroxy-2-naphthoate octaprenyltransferase|nr:1,4-dihydroxy-2-naphthoate polyprenyltransferase [Candidatus Binatota bacterium]
MSELVHDLPLTLGDVARNWREVLLTGNLSDERRMDFVSRWLIMTRATVFPMTLTSGLIGGVLALGRPEADWRYFALALIGLLAAHGCNNLMNDYFDLTGGVDTSTYPRALYAPHPVLSGWISKEGLKAAILGFHAVGAVVLAVLVAARGWPVLWFAATGLFLSIFYVAPPLKLKHRGLGEPSVFLVWGPLMIGGTYFVTTGDIAPRVWLASVPYAMLVTTVLIGKHIDKLPHDAEKGIRTLPVILGDEAARRWNRWLMIAFYGVVIALVVARVLGPWSLLVLGSLPLCRKVLRVYSRPRPESPPPRYPIWPLWYVASAFVLTRRAGALLVAGLVLDRLLPLF